MKRVLLIGLLCASCEGYIPEELEGEAEASIQLENEQSMPSLKTNDQISVAVNGIHRDLAKLIMASRKERRIKLHRYVSGGAVEEVTSVAQNLPVLTPFSFERPMDVNVARVPLSSSAGLTKVKAAIYRIRDTVSDEASGSALTDWSLTYEKMQEATASVTAAVLPGTQEFFFLPPVRLKAHELYAFGIVFSDNNGLYAIGTLNALGETSFAFTGPTDTWSLPEGYRVDTRAAGAIFSLLSPVGYRAFR